MKTLDKTRPSFVRCIKPNPEKAASLFRASVVDHQLRCSGVYSAVKISQVCLRVCECVCFAPWSVVCVWESLCCACLCLCVSVCVCVYVCVCMCMCVSSCAVLECVLLSKSRRYVCVCELKCQCVNALMYSCLCMYVCMQGYAHIHTRAHTHTRIQTRVYACSHTLTHTHTHT